MYKKSLLALLALALLFVPSTLAQDDGKPTVMYITGGPVVGTPGILAGTLDVLQSYGFISDTEREILNQKQDLEGERLDFVFGHAQMGAADASALVEQALDLGVEAIVAVTPTVAQTALNLTQDMNDPPVVIFTRLTNPYAAGIAQAPCLKPDHVSGLQTAVPYDEVLSLLLLQDPTTTTIGTIHSTSDADGVYGTETIVEIASDLGLTVESAGVAELADVRAAAQSLADKGVDAIIMPIDTSIAAGIPIVAQVAVENGLLLFYASPATVTMGATVGGGAFLYYDEGAHAGLLLAAHLNGDIDIATTAIHQLTNMFVGINLDMASEQGREIAPDLLEKAVFLIQDGRPRPQGEAAQQLRLASRLSVLPLEERRADDLALLESLQCTAEMIAEQQAALDAAE